MAFKARKLKRETDVFGLGYLYTVEFTDGTTTHLYSEDGRFVTVAGKTTKIPVVSGRSNPNDVRVQAPNDLAFARFCRDHEEQFSVVVSGGEIPDGDVDTSMFDVRDQPEPSPDILAQQALSVAESDLAALKALGLADDDATVVKATALRDAARVPVAAARKAAIDAKANASDLPIVG